MKKEKQTEMEGKRKSSSRNTNKCTQDYLLRILECLFTKENKELFSQGAFWPGKIYILILLTLSVYSQFRIMEHIFMKLFYDEVFLALFCQIGSDGKWIMKVYKSAPITSSNSITYFIRIVDGTSSLVRVRAFL